MSIIGIVCEYNPFHLGHLHQIQETKRFFGEDSVIICTMSGDFVQRGEAAVYAKHARAEAACRCGADIVLELPLPWSIGSAERFASGAVDILASVVNAVMLRSSARSPDMLHRKKYDKILKLFISVRLLCRMLKSVSWQLKEK